MTPEQWARELMEENPPRLMDGWAEAIQKRLANMIRVAADQARTEERERCKALAKYYFGPNAHNVCDAMDSGKGPGEF